MGKIALKLNGKPLDLSPKSPAADKLKAYLDKAPADEVFTQEKVAKDAGIYVGALPVAKDKLDGYSHMIGRYRYWGNPKAIKALREQTA